jgi:cytochrome c biogenesis protein CcmG/thiol:disulfide interchange protein DsbE
MKKKKISISVIIFVVFCFFVLFKALNKSNTYVPDTISGKKLLSFSAKKLLNNEQINSDVLFTENKIYLLNIWASWCAPCREEHNILMQLSENPLIEIIGLNYRDNLINAKKFINELGNPYSEVLIDKDGTISIGLGAYGIPVTYIIDKNQIILKQFVGALNDQSIKEIKSLLK